MTETARSIGIGREQLRWQPSVKRIDAGRMAAFKEQQILLGLVQQLDRAQFRHGYRELSRRLWQEVGLLNLDPERVIHLLYSGVDVDDRQALLALDDQWCEQQNGRRRGLWGAPSWLRGPNLKRRPSGAHRNAPPAAPPSRPAGR